ncbi:MAG: DUF2920 family protein [Lachnospiraceae bacterium]
MSKEYNIQVYSQPSLQDPVDRTLTIYFNEPDSGINENTGLLLFIAGYGGYANSNVYRKMRFQFADMYNLVTIQCDYFGSEFMQNPHSEDIQIPQEALQQHLNSSEIALLFEDYASNEYLLHDKKFSYKVCPDETLSNYNDMGPVQAMDHLITLKVVTDILHQNHYHFNQKKVIAYGQSHGAYLAHLCNCYMPGIFSAIIDNSAYITPFFMNHTRDFSVSMPKYTLIQQISYLAGRTEPDMELYDLKTRYASITNQAHIIAFHGSEDNMTTVSEKRSLLKTIPHTNFLVIDDALVDHHIFHSTIHGMNADFLHLFAYVYENYELECSSNCLQFSDQYIHTKQSIYYINNQDSIPIMYKNAQL